MSTWSRALKRADASAEEIDWEAVYAEQLPRVYNFFRYRVSDVVAEDLTAITFEKAWRARSRYKHDLGAFSTWLFTIAQHVATDHFRQQRDEASLDELRYQPRDSSLDELVQRRSDFAHLSDLLQGLTAREREIVALKYGAALTNREISRLTGLSETNVGTLLHRVTAKLRNAWEAHQ